jgi:hypothetical protein
MKEIGLLFSAPMARAMMRPTDPKTQTRRMPAAHNCLVDGHGISAKRWAAMQFDWAGAEIDGNACIKVTSLNPEQIGTVHRIYPRAEPGDVVWGRETWRTAFIADDKKPGDLHPAHRIWYEADQPLQPGHGKCRPAIHMPRWAARIVRPVLRMRFERLQDISESDAMAEGIKCRGAACHIEGEYAFAGHTAVEVYRQLWGSINGTGSWAANPMVLVYEFGAPKP